jgi:hypothetical protein
MSTQALIPHWTTAKDASSDRPIQGGETATMFEPNTMRDETSDAVSRTPNFGDASAPRSSTALVISAGLLDLNVVGVTPRDRLCYSTART